LYYNVTEGWYFNYTNEVFYDIVTGGILDVDANPQLLQDGTEEYDGEESGDMEMPIEVLLSNTTSEEKEQEEVGGGGGSSDVVGSESTTEEDGTIGEDGNDNSTNVFGGGDGDGDDGEGTASPTPDNTRDGGGGTDTDTEIPPKEDTPFPTPTINDVPAPSSSSSSSTTWDEAAAPFSFPPAVTTKSCSFPMEFLSCQIEESPLAVYSILAILPLLLICVCRRYCCGGDKANDERGQYREVAAQYGDVNFDNTFSDAYSDDGSAVDDDGDVEESWGKSGKRVLEMGTIRNGNGAERNGGLSLEEMNG
jgi:hypothetical protein